MIKFIKKNQKKILAVFSAGLMIAFALPTAVTQMQGGRNSVHGTIGKKEITDRELIMASSEWELLKGNIHISDKPILSQSLAYAFLSPAYRQIEEHHDLFALLIYEAHSMGVTVGQDRFNSVWANTTRTDDGQPNFVDRLQHAVADLLLVQGAFERAADVVKVTQPERDRILASQRQRMSAFVVEFNSNDYLSKITAPTDPATKAQYNAAVDAQYENNADKDPDSDSNPMHVGYALPNRVKFEYIEIPRDQVEKVVAAGIQEKDERKYRLDNPGRYVTTQPGLTLGPAPLATTEPVERPFEAVREEIFHDMVRERADQLTRDIRDELTRTLNIDYAAWQKATAAQQGIAASYADWQKAVGDAEAVAKAQKHPVIVPAGTLSIPPEIQAKASPTLLGPRYDTYEYLVALAQQIQKDHGVLPVVASIADFQSKKQLDDAAKIEPLSSKPASQPAQAASHPATGPATQATSGPASAPAMAAESATPETHGPAASPVAVPREIPADLASAGLEVDHQEVFFPSYATDFIAPISNPNLTQYVRLRVLNLDEPSAVLRDHQNDQWIFRVTQIDLAHSQPKMDVLARVQEDERNAEAQRMALADANKLLEEAQKVGLRGAATQPSMVVRTTGLFGSSDATAAALVPYQLPNEQACRSFVGQALNLLLTPSPNDPQHPVMAINLPEAHRADVVQLNELKPMWNTRTLGLEEYMAGFEELSQRKFGDPQTTVPVPFATQWFSYDAVTARLGYVPAPVDKNAPNQPQPPQNLPSQNPF